jgi:hypothetical protein
MAQMKYFIFLFLSSVMADSFEISKLKLKIFISLCWYGHFFKFQKQKFSFQIFHGGINEIFSRTEVAKFTRVTYLPLRKIVIWCIRPRGGIVYRKRALKLRLMKGER